jgi:hypothetical protein
LFFLTHWLSYAWNHIFATILRKEKTLVVKVSRTGENMPRIGAGPRNCGWETLFWNTPASWIQSIPSTAFQINLSIIVVTTYKCRSWGSWVSIIVWLQTVWLEFYPRQRQKIFPLYCVQSNSWGPPSFLSSWYQGSFPGSKAQAGRFSDHSPPSSAEVKNE